MQKLSFLGYSSVLALVLVACHHGPNAVAAASPEPAGEGQSTAGQSLQIKVSSTHRTYACHGNKVDSVQVTGSSNILTVTGNCGSLQVTGSSNSITIDSVASVQFTDESSSNLVFYRSGPAPSVTNNGTSNSIAHARGQSAAASNESDSTVVSSSQGNQTTTVVGGDLGAAVSSATRAASDLAGSVQSVQDTGNTINIILSKQRLTKDCQDGKNVNISGYQNDITLQGSCTAVDLNGWGNTIHIAEVGQIQISGHTNTITWERARNGSKPQVQIVNGMENTVRHVTSGQ